MAKSAALGLVSGILLVVPSSMVLAQRPAEDAAGFAAYIATENRVSAHITYLTASGVELKLDFYRPRGGSLRAAADGPALPRGRVQSRVHERGLRPECHPVAADELECGQRRVPVQRPSRWPPGPLKTRAARCAG